jgi:hypothetical protein
MEPDSGTTNIRNVDSKHWKRWLEPTNRYVVPFTSFSEFNKAASGNVWFAFDETRPLGLCRDLDALDIGSQGQGRRNHQRPVRLSDDRAE